MSKRKGVKQTFTGHAWPLPFKVSWNEFGFLDFHDSQLHRGKPGWEKIFPEDYKLFKVTIEEVVD